MRWEDWRCSPWHSEHSSLHLSLKVEGQQRALACTAVHRQKPSGGLAPPTCGILTRWQEDWQGRTKFSLGIVAVWSSPESKSYSSQ